VPGITCSTESDSVGSKTKQPSHRNEQIEIICIKLLTCGRYMRYTNIAIR
jgi:hypothetical protein